MIDLSSNDPLPNLTRLLGVDYGSKITGTALYQIGRDPFPLPFSRIIVKNQAQVLTELKQIISDELIDVVVLGVPYMVDGRETELSHKIKSFGQELASFTSLPLALQDETLSTFEAQERMKSSPRYNFKVDPKQIDMLCAAIILEDFCRIRGQ